MLFCAIYVVLSGIMFESGQLDIVGNEWQKELITYLLGFVLFFSFCYYASVFLSEVCGKNVCARCFASKKSELQKENEMNDADVFMNPMQGGGKNPDAEYGINPLVAAMLAGGGGASSRSDADWDMIRKPVENKKNEKITQEDGLHV